MQKIFNGARFCVFDEQFSEAGSLLVNDENIVFAGAEAETEGLKLPDTETANLDGKLVVPSFFDLSGNVFSEIEESLKNAKLDDFLENTDEIDLNYYKFDNFEVYRKEFLKLQDQKLACGITTAFDFISSVKQFTFWKRLSEAGDLKMDVTGWVDILKAKEVMDDNCRTFRKYKKHFRLGGYYFKLDGKLQSKQGWTKRPYSKSRGYAGYGNFVEEQLSFLIKSALDEKRQIVFEANGDMALEQLTQVYEANLKGREKDDVLRSLVFCSLCSKKQLRKMQSLGLYPCFNLSSESFHETVKRHLGWFNSKKFMPVKTAFLLEKNIGLFGENIVCTARAAHHRRLSNNKKFGKSQSIAFVDALKSQISGAAFLMYESERKGSLESGKLANFVALNVQSLADFNDLNLVDAVYFEGERVYKKK